MMGWRSRSRFDAPIASPVPAPLGARALLERLATMKGPAARAAHAALADALARGQVDAVREAMRAARALVPATSAPAVESASRSPVETLADLEGALAGEALTNDAQRVLEAHRGALARAIEARDGREAQRRALDAARALAAVRVGDMTTARPGGAPEGTVNQ
jgi:hypothetical protein